MEKGKRLFSGTVLVGISAVLGKLLSLCLLPFFTAALSPSELGVTEIFISTAVLLTPLFSLYAPQATFRFLARGERGSVRAGALLLGVGIFLLVCIMPLLGRFEALCPYRYLLYFYVCASLARSFLAHILRAQGRFGIFALQQGFCTALTALLQVLFLRASALGERGYLLGILLGDTVTFLVLFFCFFPFLERAEHAGSLPLGKMLRFSIPLILTAILWWGMGATEKYVLLYYHGEATMGVYAVAGRFPALIGFAAGVFLEVWHYAALQSEGEEGALFGRIYALLLPLLILAGVSVILFAPTLITRALASGYSEAVRVLGLVSVGAVCGGLASFLDSIYTLRLSSAYSMLSAFCAVVFNLVFSLLLVPRWGIVGAALAGALSFAVLFFMRLFHTARMLEFPRYVKRSGAALLMLFFSGITMTVKHDIFATALALASLLPVACLLNDAIRFSIRRSLAFLSYIGKNKKKTIRSKKDRYHS